MRLFPLSGLLASALSSACLAGPVISEFLASNDSGEQDEDGDHSDWIEIHNPELAPIELDGWALTDDATDPGKWTFPAVTLQPGDYLLVFASGKNRSIAGSELHTDFQLEQNGEYLALVSPADSIASEFAPTYPPQRSDLSYGTSVPTVDVILLDEDAPAKSRIPDEAYDTAVGTTWRSNDPAFDESSWSNGSFGVGFERSSGFEDEISLDVEAAWNVNSTVYIRSAIPGTIDPSSVRSLTIRMKYDDGFAAFINGSYATGANDPDPLLWDSASTLGVSDDDAEVFEDFDISASIPDLLATGNVLAIHGMNRTKDSSDLLLRPQLVARVADPSNPTTGYFATPTPGTINGDVTFAEVLTDTRFETGRGFFNAPFSERVTSTDPGATLIYTLNGSEPSETNGAKVLPPDAFTPPTAVIPITSTTVLRAIAVKTDALSTNVDTQTYLFHDDVLTQSGAGLPGPSNSTSIWDYVMDPNVVNDPRYPNLADDLKSIPTLSVVLLERDMWGPNGIYANPQQSGFAWERGCSVEYFLPDGTPQFQEDGGLRIQGAGSRFRDLGKKSLRIIFRQMYGAGKLDYPLFGQKGASRIDNIVLRGAYFDSWTVHTSGIGTEYIGRRNSMLLRDEYARLMHEDMGAEPVVQGGWAHVYFNGMYWGVYNLHERPDEHFAEDRFGGNDEDYDVLKQRPRGSSNGSPPEVVQGDRIAWDALLATLNGNISSTSVYRSVRRQMDVDSFADYLILNFWSGNLDWPHNNWYAIRHRPTNGLFIFIAWDTESNLFRTNQLGQLSTSVNNSPGIIWNRLRQNDDFVILFADRVHRHCFNGGALTAAVNIARFQEITDYLRPAMNGESARWGDTREEPPLNTIDHFDTVVADKITNYFPARTDIFLGQLRSNGYYPGTDAPELSQHGGQVAAGTVITLTNPNPGGTIYFTTDGNDPRRQGGALNPIAVAGSPVQINSPLTLKARVRATGGEWSALTEVDFISAADPAPGVLAFSEIHYHPADASPAEQAAGFSNQDSFEFLEIMNTGAVPVDLTNVAFSGGVTFDFASIPDPGDRLLAPGARLLLANNEAAFAFRYGSTPTVGQYSGALDNGGETLALSLNEITEILSVTYFDDLPWPTPSDGAGYSLVLTVPSAGIDHDDPANWQPSSSSGGSPGASSTVLFTGDPHGDDNFDGVDNLVHFALTPEIASPPSPGISFQSFDDGGGPEDFPVFTFQRNLAASVEVTAEFSPDLVTWTSLDPATALVSLVHQGDGTSLYSFRSALPRSSERGQFFRLSVAIP
jgi:hypothetical protein